MWNEGFDERADRLDDLLLEADRLSELETADFWAGYREDELPVEERELELEEAA